MGYRIEYSSDINHKFQTKFVGKNRRIWKFIALSAAVLALCILIQENEQIRSFLFPGNYEITKNAFNNMIDGIKAGEPLKEVATAFCVEIIDHAQIN